MDKVRNVSEFFNEIEQAELSGEANENVLLQLRLSFNLPVTESEFIEESEEDLIADLNEIECFKIQEDEETVESVEGEVEYLIEAKIEADDTDIEETIVEVTSPPEVSNDLKAESISEEIVHFEDDDVFGMETSEILAITSEEYDDDVGNYFE